MEQERTLEQIALEAEALSLMSDDALDDWVSSLSDGEFVLYQRWQNRPKTERERFEQAQENLFLEMMEFGRRLSEQMQQLAEAIGKALEPVFKQLSEFAEISKETQRAVLEFLESLPEYGEPPPDLCGHLRSLPIKRRGTRLPLPDTSHVAYYRMKPIRQYAPRLC